MKKKIIIRMIIIGFFAIISTLLFVTIAFYHLFEKQIYSDLKMDSYLIEGIITYEQQEFHEKYDEEDVLRVTYINDKGTVLYDSILDADSMENHANRPEIIEAKLNGDATSARISASLNTKLFYYARQLKDGNILRVAKETDSIYHLLFNISPYIVLIILILCGFCFLLSNALINKIMSPIEKMANNLDNIKHPDTYEELVPFIQLIQEQHENITKSANMRQEFSANVSHELKTPLTAISGYSEIIENGMASEEDVQRFASEIHVGANRLLTLINDIIRLSELDREDETIECNEQINLFEIVDVCVNMLKFSAENHNVHLRFEGDPCILYADRQMLEELVYNLCDNAIRYNKPEGYVYICVGETDKETYFTVKDTGIGISKEHTDRIFERFYRVDKSRSKSTGGTGLGLAIVKHIVAKMNARIELNSEPNVGTTISIYFPKQL